MTTRASAVLIKDESWSQNISAVRCHWNELCIPNTNYTKFDAIFFFWFCNCNKVICRLLPWGIKSSHRVMKFLTLLKSEKSHGTFPTILTTTRWIWQEETHLSPPCLREWPRTWPKMKMASSSKGWWKEEVLVKRSLRGSPKENPLMRRFFKGWPGKAKKTGIHIMFYSPIFLSKRWDMA